MLFTIEEPVTGAIWHLMNHYCIEDAIFIAKKLDAEIHSDENTFLLATCYMRDGQKLHFHALARETKAPQCEV